LNSNTLLSEKQNNEYWTKKEYHFFQYNKRNLLFDIESLDVHRLDDIDRRFLNSIGEDGTLKEWIDCATNNGMTISSAYKSFNKLKKLGIIINKQSIVHTANKPPSAYDYTFMVNVSQTCNLRCAYCYTNEGAFDFTKVEKTKMSNIDARNLVHFALEKFPQAKIYCFHFYGGEPLINFDAIKRLVEETSTIKDRDCCFEFAITTNGTLLTKQVADFMDKHHFTIFF